LKTISTIAASIIWNSVRLPANHAQPRMPGIARMKVPNMTERLRELRCPIFGFWGVNDSFNPVGGAMKIVQHAPQARMLLVNRCGHWVQVEHRDLFNRQCLDFLQHG
jgi:pimeloyl-ACP methyl ester carboxylesterase